MMIQSWRWRDDSATRTNDAWKSACIARSGSQRALKYCCGIRSVFDACCSRTSSNFAPHQRMRIDSSRLCVLCVGFAATDQRHRCIVRFVGKAKMKWRTCSAKLHRSLSMRLARICELPIRNVAVRHDERYALDQFKGVRVRRRLSRRRVANERVVQGKT